MPEDLRKRFYVHAALQGACGEGVPERMKPFVRDVQFFQEQLEAALIGADGDGFSVCGHHEGRLAPLFQRFQDGQQLFGERDHAAGGRRFRLVDDKSAFAVVAGLRDGEDALCKVDVAPLQRHEFPDAQAAVKAKQNAVHLVFLARKHRLLYPLLLGEGETFHGLFRKFRALDLVRRIFLREPQKMRRFERALDDGYDAVDAVCRESPARLFVAALQKLRDEALQNKRGERVQFLASDALRDVPLRDKFITFVCAHSDGRAHVIFQPLTDPSRVLHIPSDAGAE